MATHRVLVEQAMLAFAVRGYDQATLADIATAAHVSKGGVHHHFHAKRDLLAPVIDRCLTALEARAVHAAPETAAPLVRVREAIRGVRAAVDSHDPAAIALVGLLARAPYDAAVHAALLPRLSAVEARIAGAIQTSAEAAGLSLQVSPSRVASALVAWAAGLALHTAPGGATAPDEHPASLTAVLALIS